jgi:hypothetical protein
VLGRQRGRRGRRSKVEIEAERQLLRDQTEKEIDELVAEFHRLLPREEAQAIGVAYARYSSEFQHSIVDQVRAIFEAAVNLGIFIPREMVFYDIAVRGCKERRPGLDQVRAVLGRKAAQVLLVFTTNRLFRKGYKCMKFVEEEVVGRGQRASSSRPASTRPRTTGGGCRCRCTRWSMTSRRPCTRRTSGPPTRDCS